MGLLWRIEDGTGPLRLPRPVGGEPRCPCAHATAHRATHGPSVAVHARTSVTVTVTMHHVKPLHVPCNAHAHMAKLTDYMLSDVELIMPILSAS